MRTSDKIAAVLCPKIISDITWDDYVPYPLLGSDFYDVIMSILPRFDHQPGYGYRWNRFPSINKGDAVKDRDGNIWICIHISGWNPPIPKVYVFEPIK